MQNHPKTLVPAMMLTAVSLLLTGCGDKDTDGGSVAAWVLTSEPADAGSITLTKPDLAEGDHVVLRGIIGGRLEPMTKGAAMFVMMDTGVISCADMGEDHCATPWDYCCEPEDSIQESIATVRLVDSHGASIDTDLAAHGFAPLDEVVVVGTVGPRPDPAVLVIDASAIYRVGD